MDILKESCSPWVEIEMMALKEKQQEKVQVCENNWIRIVIGVKTVKRRIDELRVEVGVKESFKNKLGGLG